MSDAKNILDLMTIAHLKEDQHYKDISFMHHDHKYALILEIIDPNDNSGDTNKSREDQRQIEENKQMEEEKEEQDDTIKNPIIGCIQYEWMKFNYYDWRESDWEDYDYDIYNMGNSNGSFERRRMLRESGVRVDNFVRIIDICVSPRYQSKGLGAQLLQSLIYAFPSYTKFGVEVNADNTGATKCITKCGFKIARIEQQYGMRYKMTIESSYTFTQYQAWLYNSQMTFPKVISTQININKDKDKGSSSNRHPQQQHMQQHDDDQHHGSYPVTPDRPQQRSRNRSNHRGGGRRGQGDDDVVIRVHEDGDDFEEEEDEDIVNYGASNLQIPPSQVPSSSHNVHDPVMQRHDTSSSHGHNKRRQRDIHSAYAHAAATDDDDPHGIGGDSSDYEDSGDDTDRQRVMVEQLVQQISEQGQAISPIGHVQHGSMHGVGDSGGGGHGGGSHSAMDLGNVGLLAFGDDVIISTLYSLDLGKYVSTFNEFQITEQALEHLDPSVVEFMIPDENDRNKFLAWLAQYQNKDSAQTHAQTQDSQDHTHQTQPKPSKAPQQQSTDVETGQGQYAHDHMMDEDDHGIDDHSGSYQ